MNGNQNSAVVETSSGTGTYVVTAILAFAIGFGSAWLVYRDETGTAKTGTNATSTATSTALTGSEVVAGEENETPVISGSTTVVVPSSVSLQVANQVAGGQVTVASVSLSRPSWVVIREADETKNPGRILGAQLFDLGTNTGTVELLRGTVSGQTYFAMIYDDNDDHAFDPKTDLPAKNAQGSTIGATFKAE